MSRIIILVILTTCFLFSIPVQGQSDKALTEKQKDVAKGFFESLKEKDSTLILSPEFNDEYLEDSITIERYFDAVVAFHEYLISGYDHRQKVFSWQLVSTKIIFFAVLFILIVGVYFSYIQFRKAIKSKQESDMTTDIEATTKGLKISSPVLGVIILGISLVFFYLYLVYVYPIQEVF